MTVVQHLYADQFGAFIGKYSERLKLTSNGKTLQQAPLLHLQSVTIVGGGIGISADAIGACCERGIPIVFMDGRGWVYATLYASGLVGTVLTRRAQLLAYTNGLGLRLAVGFSAAKIRSQAATLRYWARNRPQDAELLSQLALDIFAYGDRLHTFPLDVPLEDIREELMGLEGAAARLYWQGAGLLTPDEYGWTKRIGRGAADPINSLLNYGYGILYAEIERAIILAGLDPYAGFLHADRPGKPSLVLDLIEEFRQAAVDRPVFGLAARSYTVTMNDQARLSDATRRDFAAKILKQLDAQMRYRGERVTLRHAIQSQARHLASVLRGDTDHYLPFEAEG
jgi:CRISP-associated protein Cas1